jgi:hypothetical protein
VSAVNVDQAIFQKLGADTGVQAIAPASVFLGLLPENAKENGNIPAVTFKTITDSDPWMTHQGASGRFRTRYEFPCWGLTLTDAQITARAVRTCLHGFRGSVAGYDLGVGSFITWVDKFDQAENLFMVHVDCYILNQG